MITYTGTNMTYAHVTIHNFVQVSTVTQTYGHLKSTRAVPCKSAVVGQDVDVAMCWYIKK